ncbi:MAG: hypothetical protein ACRD0M_00070 [Acidimicrobiales bacterium]
MIGIRTDTEATADLLRRLLGAHIVSDGDASGQQASTAPVFSVRLDHAEVGRGARPLGVLFRGTCALCRSRHPGRVLRALVAHLEGNSPDPNGFLRVRARAAVDRRGQAVVFPSGLAGTLDQLEPRLRRRGLALIDTPHATIDPVGRLVLAPPTTGLDASLLAAAPDVVPVGSYPVAAWLLYNHLRPPGQQLGLAEALALSTQLVANRADVGTPRMLAALAVVLRRAALIALPSAALEDTLSALSALSR